jgi:hypothetical protein
VPKWFLAKVQWGLTVLVEPEVKPLVGSLENFDWRMLNGKLCDLGAEWEIL